METVSAGHYSPVLWSRATLNNAWSLRTLDVTPEHEGRFSPMVVDVDGGETPFESGVDW
jgi:hypothetical protein